MKNQYLGLISLCLFCMMDSALAQSEPPRFEIRQFQLQGNTLLTTAEIDLILTPFTGTDKDFATVQEALDALQQAYRQRGQTFVTPYLPEQELDRGTVLIRVIEPKLKNIQISGQEHYSEASIRHALPALETGVSPDVSAISANLRLANENPGRKLNVHFATLDDENTLEAKVQVAEAKLWRAIVSTDNTGSKATGDWRLSAALQHNNLFERDHSAFLQYTTSPGHYEKVKTLAASYRIPLYGLGDSLDFFAAWADVDSSNAITNVADTKLNGKGSITGLRYTHNLPQWGQWNHKLVGGFDWRLYKNDIRIAGVNIGHDVVAHPFSLTYGGSAALARLNLDASLGVLHNSSWGSKGQHSHFKAARTGADASYTITRASAAAMYQTERDILLRLAANAQYTRDRLIAGEQFGLGGAGSIRGYEEREEAWDHGYTGSAEIYSPNITPLFGESRTVVRLLGFYDTGSGKNRSDKRHHLYSYGWGLRAAAGEDFSLSLDVGYARKDSAALLTERGDTQVHFKASVSF